MTVHIDGAQGEGGGQVLRTALALSAATGQPVHLKNIRANRRKPGLAPQHLAGVLAAAQICGAEVSGAHLRSQALSFEPGGAVRSGTYTFDISELAGTPSAGAVTLLLQAVLLPLALAPGPTHLTLRGGTHVAWSPPYHYVELVLLPTLARFGLHAESHLVQPGWYPQGGGEISVTIAGGAQLTGADLSERGELQRIEGVGLATRLPEHVPQRIAEAANGDLRAAGLPTGIEPRSTDGRSTGAGLFAALVYKRARAGASAMGKRGKPSEIVGRESAETLITHHRQPHALDEYLPDQLLPVLALADGESRLSTVEVTSHTRTNIAVIGHFIERTITTERHHIHVSA